MSILDFPGGTMDKNPPANAGDTVSIQEGSTCLGAAKPMGHNYSASALLLLLLLLLSRFSRVRLCATP